MCSVLIEAGRAHGTPLAVVLDLETAPPVVAVGQPRERRRRRGALRPVAGPAAHAARSRPSPEAAQPHVLAVPAASHLPPRRVQAVAHVPLPALALDVRQPDGGRRRLPAAEVGARRAVRVAEGTAEDAGAGRGEAAAAYRAPPPREERLQPAALAAAVHQPHVRRRRGRAVVSPRLPPLAGARQARRPRRPGGAGLSRATCKASGIRALSASTPVLSWLRGKCVRRAGRSSRRRRARAPICPRAPAAPWILPCR